MWRCTSHVVWLTNSALIWAINCDGKCRSRSRSGFQIARSLQTNSTINSTRCFSSGFRHISLTFCFWYLAKRDCEYIWFSHQHVKRTNFFFISFCLFIFLCTAWFEFRTKSMSEWKFSNLWRWITGTLNQIIFVIWWNISQRKSTKCFKLIRKIRAILKST